VALAQGERDHERDKDNGAAGKRQRPDACNSNPAVPGELPKSRIRGERRQQT
jgi:hypothetical protein